MINSNDYRNLADINEWREEHPNAKIINIETHLGRIGSYPSYTIWYEE